MTSPVRLSTPTKFLLALNAKANRTGSSVFTGIPAAEKAARRKKGKAQRQARRTHRSR